MHYRKLFIVSVNYINIGNHLIRPLLDRKGFEEMTSMGGLELSNSFSLLEG